MSFEFFVVFFSPWTPGSFPPVCLTGAGTGAARATSEAGGLPVPVGEPGGRAGEGREGAEWPGEAADPGARWGREGQESSPAGARRADPAPQGGAQLCESSLILSVALRPEHDDKWPVHC